MVVVLKYAEYATKSTEDKFGGLFFLIGGDDDHEFTEKNIKVDGLPAREIVYKNKPNKGLFIDAGKTVYVLAWFSNERKDLDSAAAKRFFNSFRLNPSLSKARSEFGMACY